jgi:hypothetical protein
MGLLRKMIVPKIDSGSAGCESVRNGSGNDDEALRLHLVPSDLRFPDEPGAINTEYRNTAAAVADVKRCIVFSNYACISSLPRPVDPLTAFGAPAMRAVLRTGLCPTVCMRIVSAWQPQTSRYPYSHGTGNHICKLYNTTLHSLDRLEQ